MTGMFLLTLLAVAGISAGQVLFKIGANAQGESFSVFALLTNVSFLAAIAIYAGCTILWGYVLTQAELSKVYPIFSLSFAIVPLLSYFFFKETLGVSYAVGVVFIMIGLVLTTR